MSSQATQIKDALAGAYPSYDWQASGERVQVDLGAYQIREVGTPGEIDHVDAPVGVTGDLSPTRARIRVEHHGGMTQSMYRAALEITDQYGLIVEARYGYGADAVLAVAELIASAGRALPIWLPTPGEGLDWMQGISSLLDEEHPLDPAVASEDYPDEVAAGREVRVKAVRIYTMRRVLASAISLVAETADEKGLAPEPEPSWVPAATLDLVRSLMEGFSSEGLAPYAQLLQYREAARAVKTLVLPQLIEANLTPSQYGGVAGELMEAIIWSLDWLISSSKSYILDEYSTLSEALAFGVPHSIASAAYEPTQIDPQPDDTVVVAVPWSLIENFGAARDRLLNGGNSDPDEPVKVDALECVMNALAALTMSYEVTAELGPVIIRGFSIAKTSSAAPASPAEAT